MAVEAPHLHLFSSSPCRDSFQFYGSLMDYSDEPTLPPDFNPFSDSIQKPHLSDVHPDFTPQIHLHHSEIDRFIAQHTQKVRMEVEQRRNKQWRIKVSSIQQAIMIKLKQKDDEIQRIRKHNWFLQERMKRLFVENQIWRDIAQSNEATANSLRNNLEQVLAHVSGGGGEDAESRCGGEEAAAEEKRKCRKCGEREESVVVMPCRHLCLCAVCGSSLVGSCPVCDSAITATVHINLS